MILSSAALTSTLRRYALALACGALAVIVARGLAEPLSGLYFATPLAAVALVALYVGTGPGLAALFAMAVAFWLMLEPELSLVVASREDGLRLLVFLGTGTIITFVSGAQRRTNVRLAEERAAARDAALKAELAAGAAHRSNEALRESEERFRALADALREQDRRKDEFIAVLSHELRNPLAPIRTGLEVLERSPPGSEQAQRAQAIMKRQVAQMARLIEDLLDVTRISRGKVSLRQRPMDLVSLVRRTVEDHATLFEGAGVKLGVRLPDEPVFVHGDDARLAQVVGNLLQNAAKFTPRGGHAEVRVAKDGATVRVDVTDSGAGLPAEMLPRLFEPFTQADHTLERSRGGLGLGLSLVKGLVELHGGEVSAKSDGLGAGTTITLHVPVTDAPAAPQAEPEAQEVAKRRVLVVEDNADAAEMLRDLLAMSGHEVEVVHSGPEGLERARALRPDVVLCDIGLPGMSGYEVARALREEHAEGQRPRLVALTGYASPEDRERAESAGFDAHLAKPVDLGALRRALAPPTP